MNILMHMCCAPCSMYPTDVLKEEGYTVTGLYFNPNIHPIEEFEKRKDMVSKLATLKNIEVIYDNTYEQDIWEGIPEGSQSKCSMCYHKRLEKTFKTAKELHFDAVTTSLLSSKHQNQTLIKKSAHKLSKTYHIPFIEKDFQKGFQEGLNEAKNHGIYAQHYCGCIVSLQSRIDEIIASTSLQK